MALKCILFGVCLTVSVTLAQQSDRVDLGRLQTGATVSFVHLAGGDWGIEISGGSATRLIQEKPAQIEVFPGQGNTRQLVGGYQSVQKTADTVVAVSKVTDGNGVVFNVEDRWTVSDAVLSLNRKVSVAGTEEKAGFYSAIRLSTAAAVKSVDVKLLVPGLIYGQSYGGAFNFLSGQLSIREDYLSAPLFGVLFQDGNWVAVLDMAPRGDTTQAETAASASTPVIDERIQFGALGCREAAEGCLEFGFWLPGTTTESGRGFGMRREAAPSLPTVRHRYHPVRTGVSQSYQVGFRFGKSDGLADMERQAWRWAWQSFKPKAVPVDVEVVRSTLADHLADRVLTVEDRAGVPFVIDAVSGRPGSYRPTSMSQMMRMPSAAPGGQAPGAANPARNTGSAAQNQELADWAKTVGVNMDPQAAELELWPKIIMGFCGKNIEVADQLLQESDRDSGPRGQRMRKLGLTIIESLIRIVPMSPAPAGEGFDIRSGKASAVRGEPSFSLRALSEDMRIMVDIIRRERGLGRQHPEWFAWVKSYTDWLLTQQKEDGSFPGSWAGGTGTVRSASSVTTYTPVPLLVKISEETGDKKYLESAVRAADYIWENYGRKCVFLGATGGEVADKESGMLSLEAFLALYENTKDSKWLQRAETAGSYAESWIWIWNVPMPLDARDSDLAWKRGVPTVGVQGIGSNVAGHVDQYLDWAVPSYAKLYKYTKDEHYLDVARVLLHGTKAMLALPGRTYDLLGPGWQQEHWRMGPGVRGVGAHRTWLPWISVNHLHGITGLQEFDPALYQQLANGK